MGNLGNNWAGGEDQAMYASPQATMAQPGGATAAGVQNYETAVGSLVPSIPWPTILTFVGIGIIVLSLTND